MNLHLMSGRVLNGTSEPIIDMWLGDRDSNPDR